MTSMMPRDPQQDRPSSEITGYPESRDAYAPREVGDMDESQRDKPSSEVVNGADSGDADAPSEVDPADDSQDDDALPRTDSEKGPPETEGGAGPQGERSSEVTDDNDSQEADASKESDGEDDPQSVDSELSEAKSEEPDLAEQSDEQLVDDQRMRSRKRLIIAGIASGIVLLIVAGWLLLSGPLGIIGSALSTHPHESTAEFVPDDALFYASINLRPGPKALSRAARFVSKLRDWRALDNAYEDFLDESGDATDSDIKRELFPELGPEIAFALLPSQRFDDEVEIIVFIGFSDPNFAEDLIESLAVYEAGDDNYLEAERLAGYDLFIDHWSDWKFVILDDFNYVLASPDESTLEDTIDMFDHRRRPLSELPEFQEARSRLSGDRMAMVYMAAERIFVEYVEYLQNPQWQQSERELYSSIAASLPQFISAAIVIFDDRLELTVVSPTTPNTAAIGGDANKLAKLMPAATTVWLGLSGLKDIWELAEETITDNRDLDDFYDDFLNGIDDETGVDLQRDFLDNLGDGLSFGLFEFDYSDADFEDVGIEAAIAIAIKDDVLALEMIEDLNDYFYDADLDINDRSIDGTEIWWIEFDGISGIEPAYAIVDDYIVLASTRDSLEEVIEVMKSGGDSLGDGGAFKDSVNHLGGAAAILYVEVSKLMDLIAESLDRNAREDFEDNVAVWTDPIHAVVWSARFDDKWTENKIILTLAE